MNKRIQKHINETFHLDKVDSWGDTQHYLDEKSAYAIIAAVNANRPLLVCGEPGVGKSQLARAAAYLLKREFISTVVQPNTCYDDLLWSFDHTSRLADAQLKEKEKVNNPENYISPGILWYALEWGSASETSCNSSYKPPEDINLEKLKDNGLVLLIDEIDKADISVANGLLEILGNNSFSVPPLNKVIPDKALKEKQESLIVLTSNNTRQLPDALRRRCVVLTIKLPEDEAELIDHLKTIGKTHYPNISENVLDEAANQIVEDRFSCHGNQKTGQAEYLDLLRALSNVAEDEAKQLAWLKKLSDYFKKS